MNNRTSVAILMKRSFLYKYNTTYIFTLNNYPEKILYARHDKLLKLDLLKCQDAGIYNSGCEWP